MDSTTPASTSTGGRSLQQEPGRAVAQRLTHILVDIDREPPVALREGWVVDPSDFVGDVMLQGICPPRADAARYLSYHEDPEDSRWHWDETRSPAFSRSLSQFLTPATAGWVRRAASTT
ncbi:hypothetical protein [Streptomyces sp. BBFR102]|uniref:hypothetical protein n=1 Tax=Streptomyces sp. BBFR102 TaxID=3448171 RepID=UPI003F53BA9E